MRSARIAPLPLLALLPLLLVLGAEDDGEWKLVWSDEFDAKTSPGGLPNPEKWGYETGLVRPGAASQPGDSKTSERR